MVARVCPVGALASAGSINPPVCSVLSSYLQLMSAERHRWTAQPREQVDHLPQSKDGVLRAGGGRHRDPLWWTWCVKTDSLQLFFFLVTCPMEDDWAKFVVSNMSEKKSSSLWVAAFSINSPVFCLDWDLSPLTHFKAAAMLLSVTLSSYLTTLVQYFSEHSIHKHHLLI